MMTRRLEKKAAMNSSCVNDKEIEVGLERSIRPLVSWLLCSHVADDYLRGAIASCLAQTYPNIELVIVANGEKATQICSEITGWFPGERRIRIYCTAISHLVFSLNFGLHFCRGEFIARMDSDDLAWPERVERQVSFLVSHPEIKVLGTAYEVIDDKGERLGEVCMPVTDSAIRRALIFGNPICHPSVMFRKTAVTSVGGYLGGLLAEDYDLWARLALDKSIRFHNLPDICLSYRSIGVSGARRTRIAYASQSASQLRNFLLGGGLRWLFATLVSMLKSLIRSDSSPSSKRK